MATHLFDVSNFRERLMHEAYYTCSSSHMILTVLSHGELCNNRIRVASASQVLTAEIINRWCGVTKKRFIRARGKSQRSASEARRYNNMRGMAALVDNAKTRTKRARVM